MEVPKILVIMIERSSLLQNTKKAIIKVFFRNQCFMIVKIKILPKYHKEFKEI